MYLDLKIKESQDHLRGVTKLVDRMGIEPITKRSASELHGPKKSRTHTGTPINATGLCPNIADSAPIHFSATITAISIPTVVLLLMLASPFIAADLSAGQLLVGVVTLGFHCLNTLAQN